MTHNNNPSFEDIENMRQIETIPIEPDNIKNALAWHNERINYLHDMSNKRCISVSYYKAYTDRFAELTSIERTIKVIMTREHKHAICNKFAILTQNDVIKRINSFPTVPFEPDNLYTSFRWHNERILILQYMDKFNFTSVTTYEKYITNNKILSHKLQLKRYKPFLVK